MNRAPMTDAEGRALCSAPRNGSHCWQTARHLDSGRRPLCDACATAAPLAESCRAGFFVTVTTDGGGWYTRHYWPTEEAR